MATKRKPRRSSSPNQSLNAGLESLRRARQQLDLANKRLLQGKPIRAQDVGKLSDKDYRTMLRLVRQFGIYHPSSAKLSPYRKKQIRKAWRQFEELQRGAVFAEYPSSDRKQRKTIKTAAKRAGAKITDKGVWFPRSEREMRQPVGKLVYDKKLKLWGIDVKKRKKDGTYASERRFLANEEALERLKPILQTRFDNYVGKLKKNQRLKFIIGQNQSRRAFRNMHELFRYAAKYRKDDRARATFLSELTIVVVEKLSARDRKWRKPVGGFRTDNYHEVDPDVLADFFEEEE